MDQHLDDLIAAAAPAAAQRGPELRRELYAMAAAAEAEACAAQRRLGRRVGVAGLAAVGVIGLGAAASAAGIVPWFDGAGALHQQTSLASGANCRITYAVTESQDAAHPVSPALSAQTLTVAQRFVHDFDLATVSVPAAVKKYEAADAAARARLERTVSASEIAPKETADEIEIMAVGAEIYDRLSTELNRQGLPPKAVSMASANTCDTDRNAK